MNKFALLLPVFASLALAQGGKFTLAVSDLVGEGIDQSTAAILSDRLRTELFKTGRVTVLERGVMQDILKEQGFQQSACSSDSCMVEVGQLLGVSHIVAGTLGKLDRLYTLDIRMVEVSSGKIVYSESVDCQGSIENVITVSIPLVAQKVSRHITGSPADTVTAQAPQVPLPPSPRYGGLTIQSNPPGAGVLLNGSASGATPFRTERLEPGRYLLRLDMPTYKFVDDSIAVTAGQVEKREYSLEHTVSWRDSVAAARRDSLRTGLSQKPAAGPGSGTKPRKSPAAKITFCVLSLVSGAAGIYCDCIVQDRIGKNSSLKAQYALFPDNAEYADYSSRISHNASDAHSYQLAEYILYGCAGLCAAGFVISFAF
jgi:TolB-like protein